MCRADVEPGRSPMCEPVAPRIGTTDRTGVHKVLRGRVLGAGGGREFELVSYVDDDGDAELGEPVVREVDDGRGRVF